MPQVTVGDYKTLCRLKLSLHLWHDQWEWVTCRQFSILIFQCKSFVHLKHYIFIQLPSQSDIWFWRYEQFFNFKNNVKDKNLLPLLACNSKSIFPTSDSFPLIMSHLQFLLYSDTIRCNTGYNKIPIVMDQFNLFGIPQNFKKTYILRKQYNSFQLNLLQGTLVNLYGLQSWQN